MAYPPSTYPAEQQTLPLRHGDKLGSAEFLRRYELMPDDFRAELINGVVQVHTDSAGLALSPISSQHGTPQALLLTWLGTYSAYTPGTEVSGPCTVLLNDRLCVEPDGLLRISDSHGGTSQANPDGYLVGSPELVFEIAHSSGKRDSQTKQAAYFAAGISNYLLWQIQADGQHEFVWYHAETGGYQPLAADANGVLRSPKFPGFWLNLPALLSGDMAQVLNTAQIGLNSPEHAEFVEKFEAKHRT